MMPKTQPEPKAKKQRCLICNELKLKEDHYKRPIINQRHQYVCSEECWRKYLVQLSGWYL